MKKLNSNHLKLVAIIAMTIDHIADLIFPGMPNNIWSNILHIIGRLTAPIMFFFICEGFYYTKNLKKYVTRLFLFALISHFAYCFAFGINFIPFINGEIFNQTSIMWSLAWAVVALYIVYGDTKLKQWQKTVLLVVICAMRRFQFDSSYVYSSNVWQKRRHKKTSIKYGSMVRNLCTYIIYICKQDIWNYNIVFNISISNTKNV